jgi:hypothetical protein
LLAREQPVDIGNIRRGEARAWPAEGRRRNCPTFCEDIFAYRQPDARLLLIPGKRKIDIKEIVGALVLTRLMQLADRHHHFWKGETGHGAIGATGEFLRQKETAITS